MAVIERERVEERYEAPKGPAPKRRSGTAAKALAIIVVAAVAATVALVVTGGEPDSQVAQVTGSEPAAQAGVGLRSEQRILADSANQGLIPSEAVDWRLLKTEQAANQGQIPAETLEPYRPAIEPAITGSLSPPAIDRTLYKLEQVADLGFVSVNPLSARTQYKLGQVADLGYVPVARSGSTPPSAGPLFSPSESLMIELAESGQIPMQAVNWEIVHLKRLINQGQIPRQALGN